MFYYDDSKANDVDNEDESLDKMMYFWKKLCENVLEEGKCIYISSAKIFVCYDNIKTSYKHRMGDRKSLEPLFTNK